MIHFDRRRFINAGALGLATLGLGPILLASSRAGAEALGAPYSRCMFEARIGQWFHVGQGRSLQSMKLVEVQDGPVSPELEQFGLVFRGSENRALSEGSYRVAPNGSDGSPLYLKLMDRDGPGQYYVADFALFREWGATSCEPPPRRRRRSRR